MLGAEEAVLERPLNLTRVFCVSCDLGPFDLAPFALLVARCNSVRIAVTPPLCRPRVARDVARGPHTQYHRNRGVAGSRKLGGVAPGVFLPVSEADHHWWEDPPVLPARRPAILAPSNDRFEREHMHATHTGTSEVAIFSRVLQPEQATLSVAAAKAILDLGFSEADKERMRQLSAKARDGTLDADEQAEINNYERVGHILSLMKLKARRSLKGRSAASRKVKAR